MMVYTGMLKPGLRVIGLVGVAACAQAWTAAQTPVQQPEVSGPPQTARATTPATPNSPRSAHQIKIWTNEDLLETRTPADRYIFAKEEKTAADQAAQFQALASCFAPDNHEPTPEETQKDISDTTRAIAEAEEGVSQARRQVAEDPENLRTRDQAELNRRTAERNRLLEHLHTLQSRVQESAPQSAATPTPDAPAPAPDPSAVSAPVPEPHR